MYHPEDVSTGYYMTRIAEALARDRDVHVLAGQPSYAAQGNLAPAHERRNGTTIRRVASTHFAKDKLVLRAINVATFTVSAALYALMHVRRGDSILCVTNPPTLPPLLALVAKLRGAKLHLLVHDVFPETLAATGYISPNRLVYRFLKGFSGIAYRNATSVVALGRDMAALVARKRGRREGVRIITNWADLDIIRPLSRSDNTVLDETGLKDNHILQFSGNLGRTHDVEGILALGDALRRSSDWRLLVAGFGGKEGIARQSADERGTVFLPRQSRERLNAMLNAADIFVIAFVPGMAGLSVPSRMYNVMAAGKPILAICDSESELAQVVIEEEAGWLFQDLDANALATFILSLPPEEIARRGANALRAARERYSDEAKFAEWQALLDVDIRTAIPTDAGSGARS